MPQLATTNPVTAVPAASPEVALAHFEGLPGPETDCWDVHEAMAQPSHGFVALDVRSPELFAAGHLRER